MEAQSLASENVNSATPCNTIEDETRAVNEDLTANDHITNVTGYYTVISDVRNSPGSEPTEQSSSASRYRSYSTRKEYLSGMLPYPTKTSFWSKTTHEAIISHLMDYPFELDPAGEFPGLLNCDSLFIQRSLDVEDDNWKHQEPYCFFAFCFNLYNWGFGKSIRVGFKLGCPPAFHHVIEDCILLYMTTLYPFTNDQFGPTLRSHEAWVGIFAILRTVGGIPEYRISHEHRKLWKRYAFNLMRGQQIELLNLVIRAMMDQIGLLCDTTNPLSSLAEWRRIMMQIEVQVRRAATSVRAFFGSPDFRSERLELLVVKYLLEDGVNMEVVRGLESAQRMKEDGAGCEWFNTSRLKHSWAEYCRIGGVKDELEDPNIKLSDVIYK